MELSKGTNEISVREEDVWMHLFEKEKDFQKSLQGLTEQGEAEDWSKRVTARAKRGEAQGGDV